MGKAEKTKKPSIYFLFKQFLMKQEYVYGYNYGFFH